MRYQVPQFIEVEDQVFGPLTIKQFIYIAGGGGLCFVLYRFLGLYLSIVPMIIVGGVALMLAFGRYNGRPFIELMQSGFYFLMNKRIYIWQKQYRTPKPDQNKVDTSNATGVTAYVPKLSDSKLKDLAWSLDIKEGQNPITGNDGKTNTR